MLPRLCTDPWNFLFGLNKAPILRSSRLFATLWAERDKSMKAMGRRDFPKDSWHKIAITLIDRRRADSQ
jgi:hypothetical protein